MKSESLFEKYLGLYLFFLFFLLMEGIDKTRLPTILRSPSARTLLLLLASVAATCGWVALVKQSEKLAAWRQTIALIADFVLSATVIAGWFYHVRLPNWLRPVGWLSYRFVFSPNWIPLILQFIAVFGIFFGIGKARIAFIFALIAMCLFY